MSSYSNNSNTNTDSNASNKNNLHIKLAPLPCEFSSLSLPLPLTLSLSLSLCILTFSFHILARHDGAPLSRRRVRNMFACGAFTLIWLNFEHFHVKVAPLALALNWLWCCAVREMDMDGLVVWRYGIVWVAAIPQLDSSCSKDCRRVATNAASAFSCCLFAFLCISMYVYVCVLNSIFYLLFFFCLPLFVVFHNK